YFILRDHGGIYVDCDFECLRSFEDLRAASALILGKEDQIHFCNGFIACYPGHPLIKKVAESVIPRLQQKSDAFKAVGPPALLDIVGPYTQGFKKPVVINGKLVANAIDDNGITVLEPRTLFPYFWFEERPQSYNGSWAAHHWGLSWWTEKEWQQFFKTFPDSKTGHERYRLQMQAR